MTFTQTVLKGCRGNLSSRKGIIPSHHQSRKGLCRTEKPTLHEIQQAVVTVLHHAASAESDMDLQVQAGPHTHLSPQLLLFLGRLRILPKTRLRKEGVRKNGRVGDGKAIFKFLLDT